MKARLVILLVVLFTSLATGRERLGRVERGCSSICKSGVTKTTGHLFWKKKTGPDPSECCKGIKLKEKDLSYEAGICFREGSRNKAICFLD
jgi:hypothetical protein